MARSHKHRSEAPEGEVQETNTMPNDYNDSQADAPQAPETPVGISPLVIAGNTFQVADYYAEGHPLTAAEAATLNQTRRENLRNNFAKTVKENLGEGQTLLSAEALAELQAKLDAYAETYSFETKGRRSGPRVTDPVEKEAKRLAQQVVDTALNARGLAKKDLADGLYDGLVTKVLGDRPEIREQARTQVEARNALAAATVEGLELPQAQAQAAE